jgi:hypothetical protein
MYNTIKWFQVNRLVLRLNMEKAKILKFSLANLLNSPIRDWTRHHQPGNTGHWARRHHLATSLAPGTLSPKNRSQTSETIASVPCGWKIVCPCKLSTTGASNTTSEQLIWGEVSMCVDPPPHQLF